MFGFFEKMLCPFPTVNPSLPPRGFFAFMWVCMHGVRGKVVALAVLTMIMAALDVIVIAVLGRVIDWLSVQPPERLWVDRGKLLLCLGAVMIVSIGVVALQTLVKHQAITVNLPMRLRWNFHRLMLGQSMAFYQNEFASRVTAKVMQTSIAVRETVFVLADVIVAMSVYLTTIVILLGVIEEKLIWPFAVWLLLYTSALIYFVPRLAQLGQQQADQRALLTGRVTDAYTNIATVKLFAHAQHEARFIRKAMLEFTRTGYGEMRLVSAFEIVNYFLSVGLTIGTMVTALWLCSIGTVGVGAVAASTAMALKLLSMSQWLMWEMASLFENVGTVRDGIKTLSTPPTVIDAPDAVPLVVTHGEICFEHVSFSYSKSGRRILDGLNITVKPGEKIGLIGRSGAGKSTLFNLLLRFYDLDGGRIFIDGKNIASVTQDSLRSLIGMVAQDVSLLHRSINENILYGRPEATLMEVESAARRAEANEFIHELGEVGKHSGYEAHVGERGAKLSGGQRQRIAIARVMLKDAPILLLDEATSALDSEVEVVIQQSLNQLMKDKTVIAIAHRLSTIAAMDRLIVLDGGKLVEQGSHSTLLAQGGLYAKLWAHQSGGFLGDPK